MAANPALAIRVAANLEELRKNLKESRDLIEVTTQGMGRLASSLRGDKLVQQAHNIVAAIDKVGGTAKLTVQEAARLEPTLAKAIAKLELMGQTVPSALRQTHDALKTVTDQSERTASSFGSIVGKAQSLMAVFGVGMGIGALTAFGRSVLSAGERISDLSKKMSVSAEAAQRLQWAARQSGADLEDVSRAVLLMSENLASGDRAAAAAIATLQLSFTQLRASTPDAAFRQITDAIGRVPDAMKQAELAVDVFGRSGRELLGMIREGTLQAADAATVFTNKEIEELDRAKQGWENFGNWLTIHSYRLARAAAERIVPGMALNAYVSDEAARQKAGALPSVSRPAGLQPMVPATTGAVDWLEMDRVLTRLNQQRLETAEVIARAAAALKAEAWAGAIQAVEARMARVVTVLTTMATEKWSLSREALKGFVNEIDAWLRSGYRVPDVLEQMWRGNLDLVDSIKQIPIVVPRAITALTALGQAGRTLFPPDFLAGFTLPRGLPPGPSPTVQLPAVTQARDYAAAVTMAVQVTQMLGQVGSQAWRMVIQGANAAIDIIAKFVVAGKTAAAATSAMWAAATFGVSLAITAIVSYTEKQKQLREDIRAAVTALREFGVESVRTQQQSKQYLAALNAELARVREASEIVSATFARLDGALEAFGGTAPARLQPFLAGLLQSAALTEDQRQQLEALTGGPSWETIEAAANRYNLALERLGAGYQQLRSNSLFDQLFSDWTMFADVGSDMAAVFEAMSAKVSDAFNRARQFGIKVPEFMRPLLEKMAAAGQLIDANGQKLTDLSGVEFSESIESSLDKIAKVLLSIRDLLVYIGGSGAAALKGLQMPYPDREGFGRILPVSAPSVMPYRFGGAAAAGGPYVSVPQPVSITIQAWDGASVDQWLARGGDRRLAQAVAHVSRELGYA